MNRLESVTEMKNILHQFDLQKKIDLLKSWEIFVDQNDCRFHLWTIAMFFGDEIKLLVSKELRSDLTSLIDEENTQLLADIPDYGTWRAKRGNPNYSEYIEAQNGYSKKNDQLRSSITQVDQLRKIVAKFEKYFESADHMFRMFGAWQKVAIEINSQYQTSVKIKSPALDIRDVELCLTWSGIVAQGADFNASIRLLEANVTEYDCCRLLSARAAEKAVEVYYRALKKDVSDISITQLDGTNQSWKDYDLLVGGVALDVKNARRSFSSPDTFVEHCVPKFKIDRKSGKDVSIVGVLSEYAKKMPLLAGKGNCLVLGEVNISTIRQLFIWMKKRFARHLNLDGLWDEKYLPGWLFEYPVEQYEHRQVAISRLDELLVQLKTLGNFPAQDIPGWLLILCPNKTLINSFDLTELRREVILDLQSLEQMAGLSRPTLFVYSMGLLIEAMANGNSTSDVAETLKNLFFCDLDQKSPLGLIDSQGYVSSIIDLLLKVGEEAKHQNFKFVSFNMRSPSILRGKTQSGQLVTLVAYCGGWRTDPVSVKCGASPLFLGKNQTCASCSHLVCDYCGYCSQKCSATVR